ncbi:RNA polymerase sigma factor [bacterium]|nr:MAG: RNA polymerase sigma factor [bacterium]
MTVENLADIDAELAQKALKGDKRAFATLVEKYQSAIYGYALHFFRHTDAAEDIAQETFLRAYRFLPTYDPSRKFVTWLYSIARNLCIDRHRDNARRDLVPIDDIAELEITSTSFGADPLRTLESKEDKEEILAAVAKLPEKYRTPLILCYMEEMSYQEISEVLGISLNNTKIRIFRAKKILLEYLGLTEHQ